ncbi:hypothetical protein [Jannaschia sp. LMIT008]|uniref:hypothetical protein n=1 Tax=Jannaschia maritima TaxID=3032585 RepID=UPI002811C8E0|nr:hypothetical protein [Jannaschia sp. LMIT008]
MPDRASQHGSSSIDPDDAGKAAERCRDKTEAAQIEDPQMTQLPTLIGSIPSTGEDSSRPITEDEARTTTTSLTTTAGTVTSYQIANGYTVDPEANASASRNPYDVSDILARNTAVLNGTPVEGWGEPTSYVEIAQVRGRSGARPAQSSPIGVRGDVEEVGDGVFYLKDANGNVFLDPFDHNTGSLGISVVRLQSGVNAAVVPVQLPPVDNPRQYYEPLVKQNAIVEKGDPIFRLVDPDLDARIDSTREDLSASRQVIQASFADARNQAEQLDERIAGSEELVRRDPDRLDEQRKAIAAVRDRLTLRERSNALQVANQYVEIADAAYAVWKADGFRSFREILSLRGLNEEEIERIYEAGSAKNLAIRLGIVEKPNNFEGVVPKDTLPEEFQSDDPFLADLYYQEYIEDTLQPDLAPIEARFTDAVDRLGTLLAEDLGNEALIRAELDFLNLENEATRNRTELRVLTVERSRISAIETTLSGDEIDVEQIQALLESGSVGGLTSEVADAIAQYRSLQGTLETLETQRDENIIRARVSGQLTRSLLEHIAYNFSQGAGKPFLSRSGRPEPNTPTVQGLPDVNDFTPVIIPKANVRDDTENAIEVVVDQVTAELYEDRLGETFQFRTASGEMGTAKLEEVTQVAQNIGWRLTFTEPVVVRNGAAVPLQPIEQQNPVTVFALENLKSRDTKVSEVVTYLGEPVQQISDYAFPIVHQRIQVRVPVYLNEGDDNPIGYIVINAIGETDGRYARFVEDSVIATFEVEGNQSAEVPIREQTLTSFGGSIGGEQALPGSGGSVEVALVATKNNDSVSWSLGGTLDLKELFKKLPISIRADIGKATIPDNRSRDIKLEIGAAFEGATDAQGNPVSFVVRVAEGVVLN